MKKENHSLICALAQKSYDQKVKKAAEKNLAQIKNMLRYYDPELVDNVYNDLSDVRKKLITKRTFDQETFIKNWESIPYIKKGFSPNDQQYKTERGEIVRSKSERDIANYYYHHGIPYKYECPIVVNGTTFYPDFTVLNIRTCKQFYHEHFGLLSETSYVENSVMKKINIFARGGIILGENFFFTGEIGRQTFSIKDLEIYVNRYLL